MKNAEKVITVRMPKELRDAIEQKVKEERISLNQYVNKLLADHVQLDISAVRFSNRNREDAENNAKDSEKM